MRIFTFDAGMEEVAREWMLQICHAVGILELHFADGGGYVSIMSEERVRDREEKRMQAAQKMKTVYTKQIQIQSNNDNERDGGDAVGDDAEGAPKDGEDNPPHAGIAAGEESREEGRRLHPALFAGRAGRGRGRGNLSRNGSMRSVLENSDSSSTPSRVQSNQDLSAQHQHSMNKRSSLNDLDMPQVEESQEEEEEHEGTLAERVQAIGGKKPTVFANQGRGRGRL
jgi:hypothetical protein